MPNSEITATVNYCRETSPGSGIFILSLIALEFLNFIPGLGQFATFKSLNGAPWPRPFSIAWSDRDEWIFYIQVVGESSSNTHLYTQLKKGDKLLVSPPRGKKFKLPLGFDKYYFASGSVGLAAQIPFFPEMHKYNKNFEVLSGVNDEKNIFGQERLKRLGIEPKIITENPSSKYRTGRVTNLLEEELKKDTSNSVVIACGPPLMLKAIADLCSRYNIPCFVNMEELMGCGGIGSCLGCATKGKGKTYPKVCRDGPIFNAKDIDLDFIALRHTSVIKPSTKKETVEHPCETTLIGKDGRILKLEYPWMIASGVFGPNEILEDVDLRLIGAAVAKGIYYDPRPGNPGPRICETADGMLNAIGLEGDGVDYFISHTLPILQRLGKPIIVNISASSVEEYARIAYKLNQTDIAAIEVNISCPNAQKSSIIFGTDPKLAAAVVRAARIYAPYKFIIVKLTPNVTDIVSIARAVVKAGADCLSLINSVVGMAIDIDLGRPKLGNNYGGLTGPCIKPIGIAAVSKIYQAKLGVPIIGIGGIQNGKDIIEYILAGANAVMVGTAWFNNKNIFAEAREIILQYLKKYKINRLEELVGQVQLWQQTA